MQVELPKSRFWGDWFDFIEQLIEEDRFEFALDFLHGICSTIMKRENITPRQITAICNIYNATTRIKK